MSHAAFELDRIIPISDFSRGKATRIFTKASDGIPLLVVKNNKPTAVITSPDEFQRLTDVEENYTLLLEALKRDAARDTSSDVTFEQLCNDLDISQADLDGVDDVELA